MITPKEAKKLQEDTEAKLLEDVKTGNVEVVKIINGLIERASKELSNDVERASLPLTKIRGDFYHDLFGNKINIIEVRVMLESAGWNVIVKIHDERKSSIVVKW